MMRLLKLGISLFVRAGDCALSVLLRLFGRTVPPRCVVLYYHAVDAIYRDRFARQLDTLARSTHAMCVDALEPLVPGCHYSAITFDDGFKCVLENAVPELESRNLPATIFIPTGYLGQLPAWGKFGTSGASTRQVLSQSELASLKSDHQITIASHTVTHVKLSQLPDQQLEQELADSKSTLELIMGRPISLLSLPHGEFDERVVSLAQKVGYRRIFTIAPRFAFQTPDEFVTGRVRVDPEDWLLEFHLKLLGAYRWLAICSALKQYVLFRSSSHSSIHAIRCHSI